MQEPSSEFSTIGFMRSASRRLFYELHPSNKISVILLLNDTYKVWEVFLANLTLRI